MALRKGSAYSKRYARPNTRVSKKKTKSYIKAFPNPRIVRYKMGDLKGFAAGNYPIRIHVISKENCQVRDNSLEAVRQYFNRFLQLEVGKEFYLEVKVHPHHIQRENKMITGAGADRMQTGMALSFGKSVSRAALVKAEQTMYIIGVKTAKQEVAARKLITSCKARLACKVSTRTEKITAPVVA